MNKTNGRFYGLSGGSRARGTFTATSTTALAIRFPLISAAPRDPLSDPRQSGTENRVAAK